jgi:phosphoribosylpyrophosphate synthetase
MNVIKTPQAEHLDIEGLTLAEHPKDNSKVFPNKEVYVQLNESNHDEHVTVIHSGGSEPNKSLMYLYGLLDILKERGVKTEILFTYFPYSMQDKEFFDGTLNYSRAIIRKLKEYYNVHKMYVINPHFSERKWVKKSSLEVISALDLIEEQLDGKYTVVGPDIGAGDRFQVSAFEKVRESSEKIEVSETSQIEDIDGNVLVLDDIIETGRTMSETYDRLVQKESIEKVEGAAIHGLLADGSKKVQQKFDKLYLTNSIENKYSNLGIEPLIIEKLELH